MNILEEIRNCPVEWKEAGGSGIHKAWENNYLIYLMWKFEMNF